MNLGISYRGGRGVLPLILFVLALLPVYPNGNSDDDGYDPKVELDRAEEMIDDGRLDDAIALLVDIAQNDPEQMERVQNLILEIRGVKSQVNELFDELNAAINVGDEAAADANIRAIKELDTDPNRNTLNNLILASIVISKNRNDTIRDRFYEEGNAALAAGDYLGAVEIYRNGFISDEYLEFYDEYIALARDRAEISRYLDDPERQEKIWNAYSSIAPEGSQVIDDLILALDSWNLGALELNAELSNLDQTLRSTPPEQWEGAVDDFVAAFRNTLLLVDGSNARAGELAAIRDELYDALDDVPEDFRYERIGEFIYGRRSKENAEGIANAQRRLLENSFFTGVDRIDARLDQLIATGRTAYGNASRIEARIAFSTAQETIGQANRLNVVSEDYINSQNRYPIDEYKDKSDESRAYIAYVNAALPIWLTLNDLSGEIPNLETLDFENLGLDAVDSLADPVQDIVDEVLALRDQWNGAATELAILPQADTPRPQDIDEKVRKDLEDALGLFGNIRLLLYLNSLIPLYERLEENVRNSTSLDIPEVSILVNGATIPEGSDELPVRRPSRTVEEVISPALAALAESESDVGSFLDVLDEMLNRDPPIENPERVSAYTGRAEALLLDLVDFKEDVEEVERDALAYANSARRAETGANNALATASADLDAAQDAVNRGQNFDDIDEFYRAIDLYDSADEALNIVDSFYLEILVNDVDIAADSGIDEARTALRNRAQNERSRVAVAVKENAVNEARNAYDESRYSYGVAILNQSQDFWNRAFGEDDPELDAWLIRLRNAQQALQQTVIAPNDPLFAEMNQYLNLANRYYTNGVRIAEADPRNADAIFAFQAATDLLAQVLSTFPGNEAALLLEQKILRQTNFDAWAAGATTLVTDARRAVSRNDLNAIRGDSRQKGLYAQVKVLEVIDTDFPGLQAVIYDIEVALGIIIPPPDPAVLAESRRLTEEARQIWTNLGITGSGRAVELLDQALVLWLDNVAASQLKNEILLSSEPERLPALPVELLNLIGLVEEYYAQGNFILAKAFLDRIIGEYPQFVNDPRIQDWIRKVDARL